MENSTNQIWKCPKCETLNRGEFCIVCSEKKIINIPIDNNAPSVSESGVNFNTEREKPHIASKDIHKKDSIAPKHTGKKIAIGILAVVLTAIIAYIAFINFNYYKASLAAEKQNYSEALKYLDGFTTSKGKELKKECKYQYAVQMIDQGDAQKAKNIFIGLDNYKNSAEMVSQCDYKSAEWYLSQGQLFQAYELFEKISSFKDSQQKLYGVKEKIYEKGIELYHSGNYSDAEMYMTKSSDAGREKDYLLLIQAQTDKIDISQLYPLIDFENTKEILLMDKYIEEFLMGEWTNSGGYNIKFYSNENDNSIWCQYSMPVMPEGEHWKIENGIHYWGSDTSGWLKYWSYNIISKNIIEITVSSDGKTYRFMRI